MKTWHLLMSETSYFILINHCRLILTVSEVNHDKQNMKMWHLAIATKQKILFCFDSLVKLIAPWP